MTEITHIFILFVLSFEAPPPNIIGQPIGEFYTIEECMYEAIKIEDDKSHPYKAGCVPISLKGEGA